MTRLRRLAASRVAAWSVVAVAALAYPLAVVAGGAPRFPSVDDCVHQVVPGREVMVVYGYFESETLAAGFRDRLRGQGFAHAEVQSDGGCGRVRVVVRGYPDVAGAQDAAAEAARVGLAATLELAQP